MSTAGELESRTAQVPRVDGREIIRTVWLERKFIAVASACVTAAAVVVSLLLPEYFRSTATLLPETEKGKLAAFGGLTDLAALAGVNVGGDGAMAKLYPTILLSESVLDDVIRSKYQTKRFPEPVDLIEYWEIDGRNADDKYQRTLKYFREEVAVGLDNKTGIVTLSIETREPGLSAAILDRMIRRLDAFIRTKKTTNASEQRKWIESRLVDVKKDLEKAEDRLKEFREKNRRVVDSPLLLMEQARLARDVEINSTVFVELKKQEEIAKIEEIKHVPIINVLDEARPAARKDKPRRLLIVSVTLLIGLVGSSFFVVGRKHYARTLAAFLDSVGISIPLVKDRTRTNADPSA